MLYCSLPIIGRGLARLRHVSYLLYLNIYTNTNLLFKQIQYIPFANDNHPRFTNPAKKLWRNLAGNYDISVGSLVRRKTTMSKWPKPEGVKNQDPEEHLD